MWKKKTEAEDMRLVEKNGVPYFVFKNLENTGLVRHGFSTRLGGVSEGCLSSMNLSFTRGDDPEKVRENFRRMGMAIGFETKDLVLSDQTHTTNVRLVTEADRGKGFDRERDYTDVDGLITDTPGLMLVTIYADCVPLYFVDPVHKAVGLSHSGWKGTVAGIGEVTVQKMQEMGCTLSDIEVLIGPSICQSCYEVSGDVAEQFLEKYPQEEASQIVTEGRVTDEGEQKYQLDLWAANWFLLKKAGILPEHIHLSGVCTCCNSTLLYSHRASHGKRGNLNGFIRIREWIR